MHIVAVSKGDSGVLNECPLLEHGSELCSDCACPDHCQVHTCSHIVIVQCLDVFLAP